MNIAIDARMYGLEHAGIGRYIINLTKHLFEVGGNHHFTLFLTDAYYSSLEVPENVTKIRANIRHYSLAEQTTFLRLLNDNPADIVHFPHFNVPFLFNRPFVVTIHDLLWHQVKGPSVTTLNPAMYALKYAGYRAVVRHAVTNAKRVITPSVWVSQHIATQFPHLSEHKLVVTHEAADDAFLHTPPKNPPRPHQLPGDDYILYTGSAYPHKNVRQLISAVQAINHKGSAIKLVIVSSRSVFLEELQAYVKRSNLQNIIIFAGKLSDQELYAAYHHAKLLVHPSLSEGFGLTGLEAMAVGTPVLASSAGSLPEIYGEAAAYFNPTNSADLVSKLEALLTDTKARESLTKAGKLHVKKYSWDKTATQTLAVYQEVYRKLQKPHFS